MSEPQIAVFCTNEQEEVNVDTELAGELAREVLQLQGLTAPAELSVVFVDSDTMAELNERYRGTSGHTDVLSFAIEDGRGFGRDRPDAGAAGFPSVLLGDVVVAPAVALQNAAARAGDRGHDGSVADEVALLIIHGILHIFGYDHETDPEAEEMEGVEAALLQKVYAPMKVANTRGLAG